MPRRDRYEHGEYARDYARWDLDEARRAYDATPPEKWEMMFWQGVSIALGRTLGAAHRKLHYKLGWPPKLDHKNCRQCLVRKPFRDFQKRARLADGLSYWCRECHRAYLKKWRDAQDPDLLRGYRKPEHDHRPRKRGVDNQAK